MSQLELPNPGAANADPVADPVGGPVADSERIARAALTRVGDPGDGGLVRFVAAYGAEAACAAIRDGSYPGPRLAGYQLRLAQAEPERDFEAAARMEARLACPGDTEWPEVLDDLTHASLLDGRGGVPLALWLRGGAALNTVTARACAIVGARAATQYGRYSAAELAAGLADRGITVISGGALGIDAAAHQGALAAGGRTVCVLASGVDTPYPRAHQELFDRIADDGLLVSEVPPGVHPTRARFLIRNRVIAALAAGTVVVEAALRSGALNTATWASECQRELMAVPGPVTSPASAGCHGLVRDMKAVLVTDAADVTEQIGRIGDDLAPLKVGEQRPRDELDSQAQQVLDAVPTRRAQPVATIATAAGIGIQEALAVLGRLTLLDYVERQGSGWRLTPHRGHRTPAT